MKIIVNNPSAGKLEKSYLSNNYQAGSTVVLVRNTDRFTDGAKIMIGAMGYENTEIATVDSVDNETQITLSSATEFPHVVDDPVFVLKWDQIKIYRSTTGIDGAYSELDTVDIDVDNGNLKTIYDDINGLSSYYYKISYYDSVNDKESDQSDAIAGTGYDRGMVGFLINEFFEEVGDCTQQNMSVQEALGLLNEVNDDLLTSSRRPYRWLKKSKNYSTQANNDRVELDDDVYKVERIAYNRTDGITDRTDNYRILDIQEMEYINWDNDYGVTDDLIYLALDETTNEIVLYPTPETSQADIIKVYYYAYPDRIESMTQKFQTPTSRIYKLYLLAKYYRKRSVKESSFINISDRYYNDYTGEIVKMQRANKFDIGTPQSMKPDTRHSRGLRRF